MFPYCWDVHRANVLEGGDPTFPQLTASPHSMDSMLPSGEGNYVPQGHRGLPMSSCLWPAYHPPKYLVSPATIFYGTREASRG